MIGTVLYLAALGAPELASATSDAAARLVEAAGRNFAAGAADEISNRLKSSGSSMLESATRALLGATQSTADGIQADLLRRFGEAIGSAVHGQRVAVIDDDELALLREIAAAAAIRGDTAEAVSRLKSLLRSRAESAPEAGRSGAN